MKKKSFPAFTVVLKSLIPDAITREMMIWAKENTSHYIPTYPLCVTFFSMNEAFFFIMRFNEYLDCRHNYDYTYNSYSEREIEMLNKYYNNSPKVSDEINRIREHNQN